MTIMKHLQKVKVITMKLQEEVKEMTLLKVKVIMSQPQQNLDLK